MKNRLNRFKMASYKRFEILLNFILLLSIALIFNSCASIQTPQGGPKDKEPPKIVRENPKNLTRNFKGKKIEITFDEYFKLNNEYQEISISPSQDVPPVFKIKQKTLELSFNDSLENNTTYTINFGKAIEDINESTPLINYNYVLSTGDKIDSLQISGKVINSLNNKEEVNTTVFILPLERDSLFGKKKASFFSITDSAGRFSLKNIKEGKYKIYALKETNGGDRIYNEPSEEIAFLDNAINLRKDTANITLKLFKQIPKKFIVTEQKIQNDGKISLVFNRTLKNPSVKFLGQNPIDPIIDFSSKGDSLSVWLRNMDFDSIKLVVNDKDKPLDTIKLSKNKSDIYKRNITYTDNLNKGKLKPNTKLTFLFNEPIKSIDKSKVILLEDSTAVENFNLVADKINIRSFQLNYPFKTKKPYTLTFKDGAIEDIYGTINKNLQSKFAKDEDENYGNLSLKINLTDTSKQYLVQLLTENDAIIRTDLVKKNIMLNYTYLSNGKYKVKVIEDINKNGEYDSGDIFNNIQPEKNWFLDKEIIVRPSWDQEFLITIPDKFT